MVFDVRELTIVRPGAVIRDWHLRKSVPDNADLGTDLGKVEEKCVILYLKMRF